MIFRCMSKLLFYIVLCFVTCRTDEVIPKQAIPAEPQPKQGPSANTLKKPTLSTLLHPYTSVVILELHSICEELIKCTDANTLLVDVNQYLKDMKKYCSKIHPQKASMEQLNQLHLVTYSEMEMIFQHIESAVKTCKEIGPATQIRNTLKICKMILECGEDLKSNRARITGGILDRFKKLQQINHRRLSCYSILEDYYKIFKNDKAIRRIDFNGSQHLDCLLKIYNSNPSRFIFNNNLSLIELLISIEHRVIKNYNPRNLNERFLREVYLLFLYELKVHLYACTQLNQLLHNFLAGLRGNTTLPKIKKNLSFLHDLRAAILNSRYIIKHEIYNKLLNYISKMAKDIDEGYNTSACINDDNLRRPWLSFCRPYNKDSVFERIYNEKGQNTLG